MREGSDLPKKKMIFFIFSGINLLTDKLKTHKQNSSILRKNYKIQSYSLDSLDQMTTKLSDLSIISHVWQQYMTVLSGTN